MKCVHLIFLLTNFALLIFPINCEVRTYYIAAEEIKWDYAPKNLNLIKNEPFEGESSIFTRPSNVTIGNKYRKSVYIEYTDGTFTVVKNRPESENSFGILGPTIRAEVGDIIKVVFRNKTPYNASIHPHGVFYSKSFEGAGYFDGTEINKTMQHDNAVIPGNEFTYIWNVTERAGPGPSDPSSVLWQYHSHVHEVRDLHAGLFGTIIVTKRGFANGNGSPKDVKQEIISWFMIIDENESPWLEENIKTLPKPNEVDADSDEFQESNLKHSINGYLYGNQPPPVLKIGELTRWYVIGMGNEADIHSAHWHGNTALINGHRMDVASTLPGEVIIADMVPDNPGRWLFHCHVTDHINAGMIQTYVVVQ